MAEHDENMFEQNIAKMLREMDSEIEIPEIPDVESIFEKAEEQKQNVVPFKKNIKAFKFLNLISSLTNLAALSRSWFSKP